MTQSSGVIRSSTAEQSPLKPHSAPTLSAAPAALNGVAPGAERSAAEAFTVAPLRHEVVMYGVPDGDFERASSLGVSMAFLNYEPPNSAAAVRLRQLGMRYIDFGLWPLIQRHVPASCARPTTACPVVDEQRLFADVRHHVDQAIGDPLVGGFYILDDYPGNIRPLLAEVHKIVASAGRIKGVVRPTVCAFVAPLDYEAKGQWLRPRGAMQRALLNYSSEACDAVSLYSYAYTTDGLPPQQVDWTMSQLLPAAKAALADAGWDPSATPLIGTPMAFSDPPYHYFGPSGAQLRAQIDGFCAAAASSIMPFAWTVSDPPDAVTAAQNPDLQAGLAAGATDCRRIWQG